MFSATELLWAFIGLLLTIGGTFLNASITFPTWHEGGLAIQTYSLGVTYQIGAVLLVGCLGGKNAGALSQIAYLALGLTFLPVFTQGGGIKYIEQPSFGYLLGFVPGAWLCGFLAFKMPPKLEFLALSCICGLLTVHFFGLSYLVLSHYLNWGSTSTLALLPAAQKLSFYALPGQLAVVCEVTILAFILRRLMFY
ncbi:biotin transporter BioY [Aerosakkonema funiforme]|uniref:Biotin transporter n=2 Tax=Oscillatoriophycideae TaxID=1301283 RepID=A0A926ZHE0_9CYAN|nr:biotin transporter BioY [Aerosakkonema funiforme]MBD2180801.1 biotin transporter BioY [Aerosakkonema funiforme FACHB-1375]